MRYLRNTANTANTALPNLRYTANTTNTAILQCDITAKYRKYRKYRGMRYLRYSSPGKGGKYRTRSVVAVRVRYFYRYRKYRGMRYLRYTVTSLIIYYKYTDFSPVLNTLGGDFKFSVEKKFQNRDAKNAICKLWVAYLELQQNSEN